MKIRTFKVFELKRTAIYGGICAFVTALVAMAVRRAYFVTGDGLQPGAWVSLIATLLSFWIPSVLLFRMRARFKALIQGYTRQGVAVFGRTWSKNGAVLLTPSLYSINDAIQSVIAFWTADGRYPGRSSDMRDWLNGGQLAFTGDAIKMGPYTINVIDPSKGLHGVAPFGSLVQKLALGFTRGNCMQVVRPDVQVPKKVPGPYSGTGTSSADAPVMMPVGFDEVIALIKHEAAHVCLNAAGVLPTMQHEVMKREGYGF